MPASLVCAGFFLLYSLSESVAFNVSVLFLVGGFIFPGMTHGSLDFQVMNRFMGGRWSKSGTLSFYLLLVAAVLTAWSFSPTAVFLLFLINSAYHFGETDLQNRSFGNTALKFLYGSLLLGFLFLSHYDETIAYVRPFGITLPMFHGGLPAPLFWSVLGLIGSLLFYSGRKSGLSEIVLTLAIGVKLPLVLAFGIYYILIHSRTAWRDLGHELRLEEPVMLRKAAPFTIAGCLFIAGTYWMFGSDPSFPDQPVVLLVAGLAAITLPHTIAMALLYRSIENNRNA